MAWQFSKNGGAYQYARTASAPNFHETDYTYMACWFYVTTTSVAHTLLSLEFDSGDGYMLTIPNSSGEVKFTSQSSGNNYTTSTTNVYNTGEWNHVWAEADRNTNILLLSLNGGTLSCTGGAKFPTGNPDYVEVSGPNAFLPSIDGYIAEVSVLNGPFEDYSQLVHGASVLNLAGADNVQGYWDLCGWGGDIIGGRDLTASSNGGAAVSEHPPITMPVPVTFGYMRSPGSPWYYRHRMRTI